MHNPYFSVVIATFNSEKTLSLVLKKLKNQDFPQEKIELIIVDGGSQDATIDIAKQYKARIIENKRTEPVYAKYLGFMSAKGKYIIYLDHDEVFENSHTLAIIKEIITKQKVKAVVTSGYKHPKGYAFINEYINEFGDPFSFFIYNLSKNSNFFISTMKQRYKTGFENKDSVVFSFENKKELPLIELCAAGGVIDADFFKNKFPETRTTHLLIPHFFYLLLEEESKIAIAKNTALIHYSSDTLGKYLKKIDWRIKNNIYHRAHLGTAGFTGRDKYQPKTVRIKKLLFLPYALSVFLPALDSIYLAVTRKNFRYLIHIFLTIYTAITIITHYMLKLTGHKPLLKSYDETKEIAINN